MFKSTFKHTLDEKGRIAIPTKLRQQLEKLDGKETLIITHGFEECLFAYPLDNWKEIEEKASQLSLLDKVARGFIRFFIGPAAECGLDKLGRVMVPQNLIDYASINKEVIISGSVNKIEIWSKEIYDNYWNDFKSNQEKRIDEMKEIGKDIGL